MLDAAVYDRAESFDRPDHLERLQATGQVAEDRLRLDPRAVNLTGTFVCVQAALPDMLATGWGRIVTIASSSAQSGAPNMAHYAASKGGVISLTKALAVELARRGVTANTITPSLVDTPMHAAHHAVTSLPSAR